MNMPLSFNDFIKVLLSQLTEDERLGGVAYAAESRMPAGTQIRFPTIRIEVPTDSYLGFIDREPGANWGHSARYLIVDSETGKIHSQEARFPPFRKGDSLHWRVIHKAPSVPDSLVSHLE